MTKARIVSDDILSWDSIEDIASSLEKRGLKRLNLPESSEKEIIMEIDDDEFLAIIRSRGDKTPSDYRKRMNSARRTQLISTEDFEEFTFETRIRSWDEHGRIKYQKFGFNKTQFKGRGEKRTVLEKLNNLEYGNTRAIYEIYDTKKVVKEFYDEFADIRSKIIQKVTGIPDDRGDAKQNYVQVIFDRLIFLYFLQEKNLLNFNKTYLKDMQEKFAKERENDVYEEFYKPLFFDLLAKKGSMKEDFGSLPYLNGGLFSESDFEEEFPEAKIGETKEETNQLFREILDFLGDWNWYADERLDIVEPKNLSPEVLGHIFEKTVNQKEMGAYYTTEEITHFMARNTIQPYILDQINEEFGKNYEEIDEIFKIQEDQEIDQESDIVIGDLDKINRKEIEYLYFEVLKDISVLDPAAGSGAFLLAAQEILLDVYLSCFEYFRKLEQEQKWKLSGKIANQLEKLQEETNDSMYAKKEIILKNLYGVDIDKGATEICKLRLWLSMVADMEEGDNPEDIDPLPNIDFNIRQGNTLIGFTEPVEKVSIDKEKDVFQASMNNWNENSIKKKFEKIIEAIQKHKRAKKSQEAKKWKKRAEERLEENREEPDKKILQRFQKAGIEDVTIKEIKEFKPFHWVLEFAEVYSKGGFDIIIGNPPWDKVKAERDDFFPRYDEVFRQRPPSEKDEKEKELKSNSKIKKKWEEYQEEIKNLSKYYNTYYKLQKPEIFGRTYSNEKDLSALFLERIWDLSSKKGYISQILPGVNYHGGSKKDLRKKMLNNSKILGIAEFENHGIFDNKHVDVRYKFGVLIAKNSGKTQKIRGLFNKGNAGVLRNFEEKSIEIRRDFIEKYSPEALTFPYMKSREQINIISKMIDHTPLSIISEKSWNAIPYRELDRTNDSDRFLESKEEGDYPVYGGSNIYQFEYNNEISSETEEPKFWSFKEEKNPEKSAKRRIREKVFKSRKKDVGLKKAIYTKIGGENTSKSQKGFVNDLLQDTRGKNLSLNDVKLDCNWPRIVLRHVTNSTNERTIIASVIPEGIVTHNALTTIRPIKFSNIEKSDLTDIPLEGVYEKAMSNKEMFYLLGFLNSIPFDYMMRTKIEENMVMYKFRESQLPRLTEGDDWFNYISKRAAKLNCYGKEFKEIREKLDSIKPIKDKNERKEIQAEIDASAFHAYELKRDETKYVLDNFYRVENPRMMTGDYFDLVLEKYDELAEKGPMK